MGETIDHSKLVKIPHPPEHLFGLLGNLPDVEPAFFTRSLWNFAEVYGDIFEINVGTQMIVIGSQEYVNEACDQSRFQKIPKTVLIELRALLGDGLFTAFLEEPNWGKAHRLLMPTFGPMGIATMLENMLDVSSQMVQKWDRQGPRHEIDCADDFTRLAFDTIALCAFGYRFNQFYSDNPHPFAQQMGDVLLESGKRASRLGIQNVLAYKDEQKRQWNVKQMHELCDELVRERQMNPRPELNDLLNKMIEGEDPKTGEKLSAENIRYQMATFLVAGHETTSSTLSFLFYHLTADPSKMLKAQQEVDNVVGDGVLTVSMLPKLKYLDACMKETLRLSATIPISVVTSLKDQVFGEKYLVKEGQDIMFLLKNLHCDPKVWGDDADQFRPERMLDGGFQALPPNSWKPFGNGVRACIGRGFAEQELLVAVSLILQRFQVECADPSYVLKLKSTLTIKPEDFKIRVRRRPGKTLWTGLPGSGGTFDQRQQASSHPSAAINMANPREQQKPLAIYFGGNTNTCASLAQSLSSDLLDHGIHAEIKDLDAATEAFPTDRSCVIITSTYEGQPPDNAKKLVAWLEQLSAHSAQQLKGVQYSVFGVGNSDWASTFHRVPRYIAETMQQLGAQPILPAAYTNVKDDFLGPWDEWSHQVSQTLTTRQGLGLNSSKVSVSIKTSGLTKALGGQEMANATIVSNNQLAGTEVGFAKRHMEIRLPEGSSYTAGDYLVLQGRNAPENIHRILSRFGLNAGDLMQVEGSQKAFLPKEAVSIQDFLSSSVEIGALVTKRQIASMAEMSSSGELRTTLEGLQEEASFKELLGKRYSAFDLLEEYPDIKISFGAFIDMLQPMASRQYSISSSPLHPSSNPDGKASADVVSITYDVHTGPALSGHGTFLGLASTYLSSARPGESISCFVRPTNLGFRLPTDPKCPLILIAAGTGIAPMRAFLQERAAIKAAGARELGPAILFFGCRDENKDFIYKTEMQQWQSDGIVEVVPCFSQSSSATHRYVHEAIWERRDYVSELFFGGGKIFLCGSAAKLGRSTAEVCKKIYQERTGKSQEEVDAWLESVRTDRYISDVY